jgi:hypothetical protein
MTPDQLFDVAWNQAVMAQAMSLVERRLRAEGKPLAFEVFRRYDVDGDSANLSQDELGKTLGLTARQVRLALVDARATFRQIVTDIVRGYVDDADDLAAELRAVFGA